MCLSAWGRVSSLLPSLARQDCENDCYSNASENVAKPVIMAKKFKREEGKRKKGSVVCGAKTRIFSSDNVSLEADPLFHEPTSNVCSKRMVKRLRHVLLLLQLRPTADDCGSLQRLS